MTNCAVRSSTKPTNWTLLPLFLLLVGARFVCRPPRFCHCQSPAVEAELNLVESYLLAGHHACVFIVDLGAYG